MSSKFQIDDLKKAFGLFATGVCVATSHSSGFTVNSFSSLSLNPALMIFNIYKTETDYVEFLKKDKFAINFLSSDQKDVSTENNHKVVCNMCAKICTHHPPDFLAINKRVLQQMSIGR